MTFITLISKDKQIKGQSLIPTRPRYHKSGSIFISLSFILLSAQKPIRVYIDIIVDILGYISMGISSPTLFPYVIPLPRVAIDDSLLRSNEFSRCSLLYFFSLYDTFCWSSTKNKHRRGGDISLSKFHYILSNPNEMKVMKYITV